MTFLVATMMWLGSGETRASSDYLDQLIAKAEELRLAEHPAWYALGHYRPDLLGLERRSLVDSEGFFLAENGKHDPASELEATLNAFFAPPAATGQHPQCAFIARYRWLKGRLAFDGSRLPERSCPEFDTWFETIDAASATLIFPAAYLNNPASMFGHTLLRFDRHHQTEETRLLSYAVNYGAQTGNDDGILFAVLGLTGGYRGTYSVEPYHNLVKLYSDIENRDIWEYQLNFSPAEVDRMLVHLWEMRGHHSDYYFFDENCSFQLLFLLDAARPGLKLVDDFALHVTPVDSVRSILSRKDLLRKTVFRPSGETRIGHSLSALTSEEREMVQDLAAARIDPEQVIVTGLPEPRRAAVLELAQSFVTHQLKTDDIEQEAGEARAWSLLAARSRIDAKADQPPVPVPWTRPDQGHGSARAALGVGLRDGRSFQALHLRPAYHDTLDPSGGFVPGASIEFLNTELRRYQGSRKVLLEQFNALGVRSMTPGNELIRPVSWKLNIGVERLRIEDTDEEGALIAVAEGGAGFTYSIPSTRAIWSALIEGGMIGGEDCDETCSVNIGPSLSLLWPMTDHATFSVDGRYQLRFGEAVNERYELRLGQSYGFARNLAVKLEGTLEDEGGGAQTELLSTLNWYF